MRVFLSTAGLMGMVLILWFFRTSEMSSRPPVQVENLQVIEKVSVPTPSSAPQKKTFHVTDPKIVTERPLPYEPRGNVIEFEVKDGFAIAYGDLILGKPEDPKVAHGFYDAPEPKLWESPVIPYLISPDLPNPERVLQAIEYLKAMTRVQLTPFNPQNHAEKDGVIFEPGTHHCLSMLGRVGGIQPIRLSPDCQMTEVLHEILHTLGFAHEQSRPDRDQYVDILWDNIDKEFQGQFSRIPTSFMGAVKDSPFDFHSIMLYRTDAFAKAPGTMTLRSKTGESINPVRQGLSEMDIKRLYRLFDL